MASTILPSDAGTDFSPAAIEPKEVPEETKAKNLGRKTLADDEESSNSSPTNVSESPSHPNLDASTDQQGDTAEATIAAPKPIPPHPDFEPLKNIEQTERGSFSSWVVQKSPEADGTFSIVFGEDGTYESIETAAKEERKPHEQLLAEAQVEAAEMRQRANAEGRQAGYEEGMAQAHEELRAEMLPIFEELRNSIQMLVDYRDEVLRGAEQENFELTVLIAKKVIHCELQAQPEIILEVVRRALSRAVGWGKATAQVNPKDYAVLEENRLLLSEEGEGVSLVRIEANPSISRGGCVLESNFGEIDARLEKQIEAVEKALREAYIENIENHAINSDELAAGNDDASGESEEASVESAQNLDEGSPSAEPFHLKELGNSPEAPPAS